ncbi:anthranilate synthase component II [Desulfopila aestuarii]|uniref:Aminodeoxychorismate synthase, glutamine amidotransferase subunit n=1 Tax=Desulfopila aestuarii DSM 18488 TaxID=1121416 RepID=A0A1M7XY98_9BACT|nr:aminodeoxychorismate/anthranilate synthase component II [Desulfopila aestuarii]SHO43957.1 aminodeoxychorismate synthase, glutamine amidotransferase subunit [Desulfopila aestuarii DSM 18488]
MTAKLLVIDNYDSFTYNLVQMFRQYPLTIQVHRSDQIDLDGVASYSPDYILISPGPKEPSSAGISIPLIKAWYQKVPILGVCLGMQCINEAFGGLTIRSPLPMHGKTSDIFHQGQGVFQGLPSPFRAARYHSLVVQPDVSALRDDLTITARTEDEIIMGLSHRYAPLHGVQFHPESFLTDHGFQMVENFLNLGSMERI